MQAPQMANTNWFCEMTDQLASLGKDRKELKHLGLDSDHVAEFFLCFVLPFASRHSLAISEELSKFIEKADLLLDMEEDHNTECL